MTALTTGYVARTMRSLGYEVREGPDLPITGGDADSRRIRPGQLFAAYPGDNTDGNRFVVAAFARGAVAAICSSPPEGGGGGQTVVIADDTAKAAGELAAAWRSVCPDVRVLGITGTVGKTTAKELTADVLATRFRTHRSEGGLNSRQGLPLALLSLRPDHEVSVLEMGMDSAGEITELCEMARPEIGAVLNIGLTHVEKLGSIEAIAEEKLSLVRWLPTNGVAVLNADDRRVAAGAAGLACRVMTFGCADRGVTVGCSEARARGIEGTSFLASYRGESVPVDSPLPGLHTIPAALVALSAALTLGMTLGAAAAAVAGAPSGGRLTVRNGGNGSTILDDRYNSSPASLAGDLRMLKGRAGRRIALLGKMAELGEYEAEEHRKAGRLAAECCDLLFAVGPICRPMAEAATEAGMTGARWFETKQEAAEAVRAALRPGDTVLVKASRSQEFETIIPMLERSS